MSSRLGRNPLGKKQTPPRPEKVVAVEKVETVRSAQRKACSISRIAQFLSVDLPVKSLLGAVETALWVLSFVPEKQAGPTKESRQ